jgi:hypothetical protein
MLFYNRTELRRGDIFHGKCTCFEVFNESPSIAEPNALLLFEVQLVALNHVQNIPCGEYERRSFSDKLLDVILLRSIKRCLHTGWVCKAFNRSGFLGFFLVHEDQLREMEVIGKEFI